MEGLQGGGHGVEEWTNGGLEWVEGVRGGARMVYIRSDTDSSGSILLSPPHAWE